ncbi:uncharacterized protein METZ01_LOCUS261538 [marine metagenome]|uniref:Uncharacterized protein n=1 Tax=marine metagenome TaxID=408172 RepID=A0A382J916_9ZZZZ
MVFLFSIARSISVRRFKKSICSCYVGGFVGGLVEQTGYKMRLGVA